MDTDEQMVLLLTDPQKQPLCAQEVKIKDAISTALYEKGFKDLGPNAVSIVRYRISSDVC